MAASALGIVERWLMNEHHIELPLLVLNGKHDVHDRLERIHYENDEA